MHPLHHDDTRNIMVGSGQSMTPEFEWDANKAKEHSARQRLLVVSSPNVTAGRESSAPEKVRQLSGGSLRLS